MASATPLHQLPSSKPIAFREGANDIEDFFDNGAVALHLVGPDGLILKANKAELELLGYASDEYVGRHIADFHAQAAIGLCRRPAFFAPYFCPGHSPIFDRP